MTFHKDMIVSPALSKRAEKIKTQLHNRNYPMGVYLIVLSHNPGNQLEIFPAVLLKQSFYQQKEYQVVGLVSSYVEALDVLKELTQLVYEQTGDADLSGHFMETMK